MGDFNGMMLYLFNIGEPEFAVASLDTWDGYYVSVSWSVEL